MDNGVSGMKVLKDRLRKLKQFPGFVKHQIKESWNGTATPAPNPIGAATPTFQDIRKAIANEYLKGDGLEVGPLHQPLEVPPQATVRYVDRLSVEELQKLYPELGDHPLVSPDIIDDGEQLTLIADESVDFVIANHMIEHCQNPIGTIKNYLRVVKPNGIVYLAIPDKRCIFDRDRPLTSLEHVIRDYEDGPDWSMRDHFEEYARFVDKVPESELARHSQHLIDGNYSIHFHVWTGSEFLELISYCKLKLHFPFEVVLFKQNDFEFIVVLQKTAAT
jgi:SAM-dependent methyltransferase